tara:strand:- start:1354 stop:1632 length:279 start_codon:yes stop_codon:yes gene_type:complete
MTSLISLKNDCIQAMENCISNCRVLIETHKEKEDMSAFINLCELCIHACEDCITACNSVQADGSQFMQIYAGICKACIANYETYVQVEFQKS